MRLAIGCLLLAVAVQGAEKKPDPGKKPAPALMTLPAGATRVDTATYRYTDEGGKKWIYKQTPFGLVRYEDAPPAPPARQEKELTKVAVDGDTVRFERPTPFGVSKWEKKKADLTGEERRILERSQDKQE